MTTSLVIIANMEHLGREGAVVFSSRESSILNLTVQTIWLVKPLSTTSVSSSFFSAMLLMDNLFILDLLCRHYGNEAAV